MPVRIERRQCDLVGLARIQAQDRDFVVLLCCGAAVGEGGVFVFAGGGDT